MYDCDELSLIERHCGTHSSLTEPETKMAANGKSSTQAAAAIMGRYTQAHHAAFVHASKGISKAIMYQVKGVPSVVIDGKYQVVGTQSPSVAMAEYNRFLGGVHA